MKLLFYSLLLLLSVTACGQAAGQAKPVSKNDVPDELLTDDSTHWTISTVSTMGYVNTTPGAYYNTYRSGGGMLVKFKFKKGNRFSFQLYVQANSYGTNTETWTEVEGAVEFTKDAKGQNIFITKAEKGVYRIIKNGTTTTRAITDSELKGQHSCTYLWEKTTFPEDPKNSYLLTVDLEKYPNADVNNPQSIDPSWVSKFHIPNRK